MMVSVGIASLLEFSAKTKKRSRATAEIRRRRVNRFLRIRWNAYLNAFILVSSSIGNGVIWYDFSPYVRVVCATRRMSVVSTLEYRACRGTCRALRLGIGATIVHRFRTFRFQVRMRRATVGVTRLRRSRNFRCAEAKE